MCRVLSREWYVISGRETGKNGSKIAKIFFAGGRDGLKSPFTDLLGTPDRASSPGSKTDLRRTRVARVMTFLQNARSTRLYAPPTSPRRQFMHHPCWGNTCCALGAPWPATAGASAPQWLPSGSPRRRGPSHRHTPRCLLSRPGAATHCHRSALSTGRSRRTPAMCARQTR